jgi:hypothetical protein
MQHRRPTTYAIRILRLPGAVLLCLLALCWAAYPAAAQEPPPTIPEYAALVREATAAAERGDRLEFDPAAERLIWVTGVRAANGAVIPVDNSWLREATAGANPDLQQIAARLGAISDALAHPAGAAPADARERLAEIYARPPLARPESQPPPRWFTDLIDAILRLLDRILTPVTSASPAAANVMTWGIAIVGGLLLLGVILYLLIGLRRGMVAEAQAAQADPDAGIGSRGALERASALATAGDHRSGMRYLYLSALLWLDEHGALRYDRALTNREHLAQLNERPALRRRLAPVVDTFDRVWYGHATLDADAFAGFRAQVEQLKSDGEKSE